MRSHAAILALVAVLVTTADISAQQDSIFITPQDGLADRSQLKQVLDALGLSCDKCVPVVPGDVLGPIVNPNNGPKQPSIEEGLSELDSTDVFRSLSVVTTPRPTDGIIVRDSPFLESLLAGGAVVNFTQQLPYGEAQTAADNLGGPLIDSASAPILGPFSQAGEWRSSRSGPLIELNEYSWLLEHGTLPTGIGPHLGGVYLPSIAIPSHAINGSGVSADIMSPPLSSNAIGTPVGPIASASIDLSTASETETCDASMIAPFDAKLSLINYQDTQDFLSCNKAARDLLVTIRQTSLEERSTLYNPEFLKENPAYFNVVKSYADACLRRLSDERLKGLLSAEQINSIMNNIGTIRNSGGSFCVGARVNDKLLTAKHCFATPRSDGTFTAVRNPTADLLFTTFAGTDYKVSLASAQREHHYRDLSLDTLDRDFTLLTLTPKGDPHDDGAAPLVLRPDLARQWQRLLLVSIQPYLKAQALLDDGEAGKHLLLDPSVDIAPTCSIFVRDGNYILHACQTEVTMSGTPMLAVADNQIGIIGVHTGESSNLQTSCGRNFAPNFPNYGVVIPELETMIK